MIYLIARCLFRPLFFFSLIYVSFGSCSLELKNAESSLLNTALFPLKGKKILLLYTGFGVKGGTRSYKISLYQYLIKDQFETVFFLIDNPDVQDELNHLNIPYYLCRPKSNRGSEQYNQEILKSLCDVCAIEPIGIINANREQEVVWAKKIATRFPLKVVLTLHVENLHTKNFLRGLDGVLGVSPQIAQLVAEQNKLKHLGIKVIDWSAPFFNAKKFLEYKPKDDRAHFFRDNFGITLSDSPTVCMVANFLSEEWKDHPALLEAIRILVQDRDVLVQLLLAGDGPRLKNIKKLARTLGIEKSVFFLGYTTKIPELISFSDIKVVSSKSEAFCIALLEAALLKKPLIGTRGTGMENIVKDEDTGLLFARGDSKDLADKIEFLLKNEQARSELGLRAFSFVNENFLPEVSIKRIERFYTAVLSTTGS